MMRSGKFTIIALFLALVSMSVATIDTSAQTRRRPVIRKKTVVKKTVAPAAVLYTVSTGKHVQVRMNETISSKTARVGNTFTATTIDPVYSTTGVVVIPQGSELVGRVDAVTPARKGGNPGTIDVSFTRLRLPNGLTRRVNGSLTDLYSDDAKSDIEGTASGDRLKHRKIIFIGGGGVGGAVLGGAVGGGKGALIGGILGAAGGFLGERYTKGEEAEVRSGTQFGVILNQPLSLPRYKEVEQ